MRPGPSRTVTEVLGAILGDLEPLPAAPTALREARGRVLADDVVAATALPPEARAAMDGVAVRAADVEGATSRLPRRLTMDGASLAGRGDRRPLGPGTAREIATGAPLPPGADAVVRVEELSSGDGWVEVHEPVAPGRDVRPAGDDAALGHVLARAGRVVDAGALGGLAGAGVTEVCVVPWPRVVVLPTGDEVVAGSTPDAVGPMLDHLLSADGAGVDVAAPVPDDPAQLVAAVSAGSRTHDLVITVGGASVGRRDHAGDVVAGLAAGETISLAMRPGRPFAWGRTEAGTTVLCLPGSPLAALAAAVLLVRPVVARLAGRRPPRPVTVPLAAPVVGDPRRRSLIAATVDDGHARAVPGHGAADLARLARTSALVDLPAGTERLEAGHPVDAWPLP